MINENKVKPTLKSDFIAELNVVIAQRIREYRQGRKQTVANLAASSGISKGMMSKIENGQASPSLATLGRIARALEVPVTSLFRGLEEEHDALYVAAGKGLEIIREGTRAGHRYQLLGTMRGVNRRMEPLLVTLSQKREVFPLFQHPGTELLYMLEGALEYGHGNARYVLRPGDTLQFDGEIPHGPTKIIKTPVRFLSIIAYGNSASGSN
ncbi:MAG: helix-turn-helix transcriptional regulator [Acidimicrobiaceae bacterium]|nr:helix-turn-helix transcriptional regulator [Acidimicrobiaceae bacterium]